MHWILLVWFNVYQPVITMQEFNDQAACENAVSVIKKMNEHRGSGELHLVCVPKGSQ